MISTVHPKVIPNQLSQQLPQMKTQLDTEVKRILQDLSTTKHSQFRNASISYTDSIFALKLAKYDPEAQ
jgi:hypothetical protein